jgi:putative addiction module component (TIGR02574 family)
VRVSPEQLQAELLQLPADVRARLAEALLASLDEPDAELDIAWADEAERRSQELRSGNVKPIPAAEARARVILSDASSDTASRGQGAAPR